MKRNGIIALSLGAICFFAGFLAAQTNMARKNWTPGKGYGWVWGKNDEVGALNTLTSNDVKTALTSVKDGKVYDLGIMYDRTSYKWPGHSPGEIMTFRSPEGVKRQKDLEFAVSADNSMGTAWHSCSLFLSDNIATQIDSLGHITAGKENHWYNGFKEEDWGGNWGIRKCGAETIPPIITRGVMIDVAAHLKMEALPSGYRITPKVLQDALAAQKTEIKPGDAVFVRTGTLRFWGDAGGDHEKLKVHDSAGIDLDSAKWLVEQKGAVLVGSDTSGLEVGPAPEGSKSFNPVHDYLLIRQGVHIAEFHNLEELSKDKTYSFAYICLVNKIKGATAGFALRPVAIK